MHTCGDNRAGFGRHRAPVLAAFRAQAPVQASHTATGSSGCRPPGRPQSLPAGLWMHAVSVRVGVCVWGVGVAALPRQPEPAGCGGRPRGACAVLAARRTVSASARAARSGSSVPAISQPQPTDPHSALLSGSGSSSSPCRPRRCLCCSSPKMPIFPPGCAGRWTFAWLVAPHCAATTLAQLATSHCPTSPSSSPPPPSRTEVKPKSEMTQEELEALEKEQFDAGMSAWKNAFSWFSSHLHTFLYPKGRCRC